MASGLHILSADSPETRLGRLLVAGEVMDDVPVVDGPLRVLDAYVLSFVTDGEGSYRHADGRIEPIRPGMHTIIRPGVPHWYGTAAGERWTEVFAVFIGPQFDLLAEYGVLGPDGPHHHESPAAAALLRTLLATPARTTAAAEHQVLALADWLLDANRKPLDDRQTSEITRAAEQLAADLSAAVDLRVVAAETGLSYDVFRHRFKTETGQSPAAYRNSRRLDAAAALLRHTDLTLRRIARTLGYADEFHLSRRFRAHFGVPPSALRHRSRSARADVQ